MSEVEPPKLPDMTGRLTHGEKVFIILHKDPLRERIDVRASEVLGLENDVLFLAQTEPPVTPEQIGDTLETALLLEDKGTLRPVGYAARLLDIRADYPLPDHTESSALAVSAPAPEDFFETSLRMHYRVPVEEDMGVFIRLEGLENPDDQTETPDDQAKETEGPELLDFSAGGARVRLPAGTRLEIGQGLPFKLIFLGSGYADGIGVVRSIEPDPDNNAILVGLFFTNMEIRDIRYMERMVARIVSACRQRERDASYS